MARHGRCRRWPCALAAVTAVSVTAPVLVLESSLWMPQRRELVETQKKKTAAASPRSTTEDARHSATRLVAAASHALPFVVYQVFCAEREGCAWATFVAQMEGACDARRAVLEGAGLDEWPQWRANLTLEHADCPICVASKTATRIKRAFKRSLADYIRQRLPGDELRLSCFFNDETEPTPATVLSHSPWLRQQSTLVFRCAVPPRYREAALSSRLEASIAANVSRDVGAYPSLGVVVQKNVTGVVGACAWTRGGRFSDRAGKDRGLPAARVAEWLAHHYALGVDHFLIMDNSPGVYRAALSSDADHDDESSSSSSRRRRRRLRREEEEESNPPQTWMRASPLWGAIEPLYWRGRAALAPWPTLVEDEVAGDCTTEALERRVARGTDGAKTTQSFFGRPSQYAAQNACHRRLVAAGLTKILHVDVDEFVVPKRERPSAPRALLDDDDVSSQSLPLRRLTTALDAGAPAVSLACIFYGPCDGAAVGARPDHVLLADAQCAGKIAPFRKKLIAAPDASYLWVHYVRASTSRRPVPDVSYDQAVVVHVRGGYSLADADAARAVNARLADARERTFFTESVQPRFQRLACPDAARNAERRFGDAGGRQEEDPLGAMGCDDAGAKTSWGWCWCRDDHPDWAAALRTQLLALYSPAALASLRDDAGFPPTWPSSSS